MAAFGNKTYQHSFLIAKKEIEDGLSERINFDNVIYHYDDDFVQNDNHKVMNRVENFPKESHPLRKVQFF